MSTYSAPLRDMHFVLRALAGIAGAWWAALVPGASTPGSGMLRGHLATAANRRWPCSN